MSFLISDTMCHHARLPYLIDYCGTNWQNPLDEWLVVLAQRQAQKFRFTLSCV